MMFIFNINIVSFCIDYGYNKSEQLIVYSTELIELINNNRIENNLKPLKQNDVLMLVADMKAKELPQNFNSNTLSSKSVGDLLENYGYFNSMYEPTINIAQGPENPYALIEAWLERDESKKLLLSTDIEEIGASVVREGGIYYWIVITYSQNLNEENYIFLQAVLNNIITDDMTLVDKIKSVHDFICSYIDYDYSYKSRSITDVLKTKTAVCQGYANLFKAFMDILGIQNNFVVGHANGEIIDPTFTEYINHSWNTVIIDNIEYHIDTTWDDATKDFNLILYDCFMIDKNKMDEIHEKSKLIITDYYGTYTGSYVIE